MLNASPVSDAFSSVGRLIAVRKTAAVDFG
jgi:hypothetical protein